ncbi:TPA: hypothetical protein ACH3X1_007922 [Trebouxia sp. C0004]
MSQAQPAGAATHRLAQDKLGRRILVSLLTVIFYYYPSILTTTLSLFTCYRLDTLATFNKYPGNVRTFALASAQMFALALSAYFQLSIMLMILVIGFAILAFFQPFETPLSQATQGPGRGSRHNGRDMTLVPARSNAALLELQWSIFKAHLPFAYEQSDA